MDLQGNVIGVNSMIIGRGTGIGFAIPSAIAQNVTQQLIHTGRVRRAWLGVTFQPMTPELAAQFPGVDHGGALISSVVPSGPAARAGLRTGDVVVLLDRQPVRRGHDLLRLVLRKPVGTSSVLGVIRNGHPTQVTVHLTERPDNLDQHHPRQQNQPSQPHSGGFGMQVEPLTPQIRQQLGYQGHGQVVVSNVVDGSDAERAGLRAGDVIVQADRQPVRTTHDVERALGDGHALLLVERSDGRFFTVLSHSD